ncbi:hypothetical protein SAMD00019534_015600 [Acytostelium subglobosum LB1]|uniref:hypothetical protein n=1 Tax=Acytostelium subglobosum LB1 TaxID=1410327 RepID=UPI000644DA84|nr:hypothetical protein SAMD00019534_015600 [Acytostelium subglobosum LB1]GAM18385.1 hypothetical protein SAMD00019534_015600 [Acytostelium subglobosum LB1]|eukprot:XP_012757605.1 hypothetical protein SAMD00019534_015600 [Acytostelium subglobosum LB1]
MPTPIRKSPAPSTPPPSIQRRGGIGSRGSLGSGSGSSSGVTTPTNRLKRKTVDSKPSLDEFFQSILVFHCIECSAVVGDSTMLVDEATEQQEQYMLAHHCYLMSKVAHNVLESTTDGEEIDEHEHVNNNNNSNNNNIILLSCPICHNPLGRRYTSIASDSEQGYLANLFIIDNHSISFYQLGSGKDSAPYPDQTKQLPAISNPPLLLENQYVSKGSIGYLNDRVITLETHLDSLLELFGEYIEEQSSKESMSSSSASGSSSNKDDVIVVSDDATSPTTTTTTNTSSTSPTRNLPMSATKKHKATPGD